MTQVETIEQMIEHYLDAGETDITKIYDEIERMHGFPRATIRRTKSNLAKRYQRNIEALQAKENI